MKRSLLSWNSIPRTVILCCILFISIDNSSATSQELKAELRGIHQEIGSLRDENRQQNMEIALLKEKIGIITKDSDDRGMVTSSLDSNHRNKRPVRLLPPHILYRDRKNETQEQKEMNLRRYEQPNNCSDLSILGYTLNGFYLVKSNESSAESISTNNDIKLETVYCAFKQPDGKFNSSLVEKRIISRRETKQSSGKVLYFHATRKTDWHFSGLGYFNITFDKVIVNLENDFDTTTGTFTVQKSGVYLFIFRGLVSFLQENVTIGNVFGWIYYMKNDEMLAPTSINGYNSRDNQSKSTNVQLDKLIASNRLVIKLDCEYNHERSNESFHSYIEYFSSVT